MRSSGQHREYFLALQEGREDVAVLPILDVKTRWNSTHDMIARMYRLKMYQKPWLAKFPELNYLCVTNDEWRAMEYVLSVMEPFKYWTLVLSQRHSPSIHQIVAIYDNVFNHFDAMLAALHVKSLPWKKEIHRAVGAAKFKLSLYYAKVVPKTQLLLLLAVMLDPFQKCSLFHQWDLDHEADKTPIWQTEDDSSGAGPPPGGYKLSYQQTFLDYFEANYLPPLHEVTPNSSSPTDDSGTQSRAAEKAPAFKKRSYDMTYDDGEESSAADPVPTNALRLRARQLAYASCYIKSAKLKRDRRLLQALPEEPSLERPNVQARGLSTDDPISYWKRLEEDQDIEAGPLLAMVRDTFGCVPHTTGVESSFSVGRKCVSWQQHRIGPKHLRSYVLYRSMLKAEVPSLRKEARQRIERVAYSKDFLRWKKSAKERERQMDARRESMGLDQDPDYRGFVSCDGDSDDDAACSLDRFEDDGESAMNEWSADGVDFPVLPRGQWMTRTKKKEQVYDALRRHRMKYLGMSGLSDASGLDELHFSDGSCTDADDERALEYNLACNLDDSDSPSEEEEEDFGPPERPVAPAEVEEGMIRRRNPARQVRLPRDMVVAPNEFVRNKDWTRRKDSPSSADDEESAAPNTRRKRVSTTPRTKPAAPKKVGSQAGSRGGRSTRGGKVGN